MCALEHAELDQLAGLMHCLGKSIQGGNCEFKFSNSNVQNLTFRSDQCSHVEIF